MQGSLLCNSYYVKCSEHECCTLLGELLDSFDQGLRTQNVSIFYILKQLLNCLIKLGQKSTSCKLFALLRMDKVGTFLYANEIAL